MRIQTVKEERGRMKSFTHELERGVIPLKGLLGAYRCLLRDTNQGDGGYEQNPELDLEIEKAVKILEVEMMYFVAKKKIKEDFKRDLKILRTKNRL
tara:strand:+ start:253 stop:540 length:288 start_codon:yes stop_codon:yes gene_type:complete